MSPFSRPSIDQPKFVGDIQQVRVKSNATVTADMIVVLRFVVLLSPSVTDFF
jgi:hypothetical protein